MVRGLYLFIIFLSLGFSGCGYSWQSKKNPWRGDGIEKVYIQTLTNNTLRVGLEVSMTSALIREFERGAKFRVVSDPKDADAVVKGTIDSIGNTHTDVTVSAITNDPAAAGLSDAVIASEYTASATVSIWLERNRDRQTLWRQTFSRQKVYPSGNRFGLPGTTSSLINASQEKLALDEVAGFIAGDAYDTMLEAF
jgi:hypothetical protein